MAFAKGKNVVELGELDVLIEQQAQFGRRLTLKNKWTNEQKNVYIQHVLRRTVCECWLRKLLNCNRYASVENKVREAAELG